MLKRITAAILMVLVVPVLLAQQGVDYEEDDNRDRLNPSEGIELGSFLLSPAIELAIESRDNIFFTPDNEIDDLVYMVRGRLMIEKPIYDSYIRFNYVPQFRWYQDYEFDQEIQHFADLVGGFNFSNGGQLKVAYHFTDGNLETRIVDPGSEVVFGDTQFMKHAVDVDFRYWLTPRDGIRLRANTSDLSYDKDLERQFYDYSDFGVGIAWVHQINETLQMDVAFDQREFDETDAQFHDQESQEFSLGLDGALSHRLTSEIRIGYRKTEPEKNDIVEIPDFTGIVYQGFLKYSTTENSTLQLGLERSDYPSAYDLNNYYTSNAISLTYQLNRERLFGSAKLSMRTNEYEIADTVTGELREDDVLTIGFGLGYRFTDTISVRGNLTHQDRDSMHQFEYKANIVVIGLVVGY